VRNDEDIERDGKIILRPEMRKPLEETIQLEIRRRKPFRLKESRMIDGDLE
jgi:hypothetical protein